MKTILAFILVWFIIAVGVAGLLGVCWLIRHHPDAMYATICWTLGSIVVLGCIVGLIAITWTWAASWAERWGTSGDAGDAPKESDDAEKQFVAGFHQEERKNLGEAIKSAIMLKRRQDCWLGTGAEPGGRIVACMELFVRSSAQYLKDLRDQGHGPLIDLIEREMDDAVEQQRLNATLAPSYVSTLSTM